MRRVLWMAVGAAAGMYVAHRAAQARAQMTPENLALRATEQASLAGGAVRAFVDDVMAATRQREDELREALGVADLESGPAPGADRSARRGAHRRATGADAQRLDELLGRPGPDRFARLPDERRVRSTTPDEPRVRSTTPNEPRVRSTTPDEPRVRSTTPDEPRVRSTTPNEPRVRSTTPNGTPSEQPSLRDRPEGRADAVGQPDSPAGRGPGPSGAGGS